MLRCLNNHILTPADFQPGDDADRPLVLVQDGVKRFIREIESRFEGTVKHPHTGAQISYRRLILEQSYQLARILREGQPASHYQPHTVR